MEQYQFLIAGIVIVGIVSYIVASSQSRGSTRAKPLLPPDQPRSVRRRPIAQEPAVAPQPRGPRVTPATPSSAPAQPSVSSSPAGASAHTASMAEQQAYRALLAKAHGDQALVERLIAYEQKRDPYGTQLTWIQNANARWERDNR